MSLTRIKTTESAIHSSIKNCDNKKILIQEIINKFRDKNIIVIVISKNNNFNDEYKHLFTNRKIR